MKINLKLQVNLRSGAEIKLAAGQYQAIAGFVEDIVFKSSKAKTNHILPHPKKRHSKKLLGNRAWTPAEEARLNNLVREYQAQGKSSGELHTKIGQALGRSKSSIINRLGGLKTQQTQQTQPTLKTA